MTKVELVAKIAEIAALTKIQAEKALNGFIAVTTDAIKAGDKITLTGFGTFSAVSRAARKPESSDRKRTEKSCQDQR